MRRLIGVGFVLVAAAAAAQTVTVTRPGAPAQTFDCSVAPGCTIAVAPPVVTPPPPPPPPPPPVDPPPTDGAVLFRMDCAKGWPRCGFDGAYGEREGTHFRRERLVGQAPSGRDAVRLTLLPASGQFEWGWYMTPRQAVPQGAVRYLRWRFRAISPIAWGGSARRAGGKLVILGNLCENAPYAPTRVISNIEAPSGSILLRTEQGIAGPPSRFDASPAPAPDVWHSVQLTVRSSSTATSNDGLLTMELDGRQVGQSSGGFNLKTAGWSTAAGCGNSGITFGDTFNPLANGQHFVLDVADFEYGTAYDPTWGAVR